MRLDFLTAASNSLAPLVTIKIKKRDSFLYKLYFTLFLDILEI